MPGHNQSFYSVGIQDAHILKSHDDDMADTAQKKVN